MFSGGQFLGRKSDEKESKNGTVDLAKLCEGYQKSLFWRFEKIMTKLAQKGCSWDSILEPLATKIDPERPLKMESNFGRDPSGQKVVREILRSRKPCGKTGSRP